MVQVQGLERLEEVVCHSPYHRKTCIDEHDKENVIVFFKKLINTPTVLDQYIVSPYLSRDRTGEIPGFSTISVNIQTQNAALI